MIQEIVEDGCLLEIYAREVKYQVLDYTRLVSLVPFMLALGKPSSFPSAEAQVTEINGRREYKIKT